MTNLIDSYLLKSGMPKHELCVIERTKRAFYYYGIAVLGVIAVSLMTAGLTNILG